MFSVDQTNSGRQRYRKTFFFFRLLKTWFGGIAYLLFNLSPPFGKWLRSLSINDSLFSLTTSLLMTLHSRYNRPRISLIATIIETMFYEWRLQAVRISKLNTVKSVLTNQWQEFRGRRLLCFTVKKKESQLRYTFLFLRQSALLLSLRLWFWPWFRAVLSNFWFHFLRGCLSCLHQNYLLRGILHSRLIFKEMHSAITTD